jgi:hypothetical protein
MKCLLAIAGLFIMFIIGMNVVSHGQAVAAEAQLIKIQPVGETPPGGKVTGIYLDPQTLRIEKNTIVIWMNGLPQQEIQVSFKEGKACRDVTINPVLFKLDTQTSCYVTSYIPYADTSSLQFPQSGTFKYIVQTADGKIKAEGEIIVRK